MTATTDRLETTLDDFVAHPPNHLEWLDGCLVPKNMTVKHSKLQARLARFWGNYLEESNQGGEVYTELPCVTINRGRRPDVCYLTAELAWEYADRPTLPHSPPLVAEIASPTDYAEEVFARADEYLASRCREVWLIFPESGQILIRLPDRTLAFQGAAEIATQVALPGFSIPVERLLA